MKDGIVLPNSRLLSHRSVEITSKELVMPEIVN
jgi:hypothetical protein